MQLPEKMKGTYCTLIFDNFVAAQNRSIRSFRMEFTLYEQYAQIES